VILRNLGFGLSITHTLGKDCKVCTRAAARSSSDNWFSISVFDKFEPTIGVSAF
jgi:hypothetical protein